MRSTLRVLITVGVNAFLKPRKVDGFLCPSDLAGGSVSPSMTAIRRMGGGNNYSSAADRSALMMVRPGGYVRGQQELQLVSDQIGVPGNILRKITIADISDGNFRTTMRFREIIGDVEQQPRSPWVIIPFRRVDHFSEHVATQDQLRHVQFRLAIL